MITITALGPPIGQPRQRHGIVAGHVRNWTPTKHPVNAYKATIREAAASAGVTLLDGPVALLIVFVFPRPKNMVWKRKPMPSVWHVKTPDLDNCCKATMDALSGIAWRDDAQVADIRARKRIAAGDESPRTVVSIHHLLETDHDDSDDDR